MEIVKLQDGREADLTTPEKRALSGLLLQSSGDIDGKGESGSNIELELRMSRSADEQSPSAYFDTRCLMPTSNPCKRLFSIAGYALTNRDKGIILANLESQLFLLMNRTVWGAGDVKNIVHK